MKKKVISIALIIASVYCYYGVSEMALNESAKLENIIEKQDALVLNKPDDLQTKKPTKLPRETYRVQKFYLVSTVQGLSTKQITDHEELYKKYVNKRNEIDSKLEGIDRSKPESITYSEFRELKVEETFARNADILHKLYFQNLEAGRNTKVGPETERIIIENFGSIEAFKADLFATARSARGWALTCYDIDSGRVHNFLLDSHNTCVPIMAIPILVLDVYEHAYWLDFGDQRNTYLDIFWKNINWKIVEDRIVHLVRPLLDAKKAQEEKDRK